MTVYGGSPSRWPDDREQPPQDQPPGRDEGYGPPGPDPRAGDWAAEPGTAAWGADAGAAVWGGDGRGADPATAAWRADTRPDPRSGDPRSGDRRPGDSRAGDPRPGDPQGGELRGGDFRATQPPGSAWAPDDDRGPQPTSGPAFGGGAQGTSQVRGSASPAGPLFDPSGPPRGAAPAGYDGPPPMRGSAAPPPPPFDAGLPARGSAQPTGSLFDPGAQATGQVRGSAQPSGSMFETGGQPTGQVRGGAQPSGSMFETGGQPTGQVRGSASPAGPLFDPGAPATGQVRGSARPVSGTYGAAAVPGAEPTGTFRDADPQATGAFREARPPATGTFRDADPQAAGTFRDGDPQATGSFRDGRPPATGTFRDADPQATGAFREGRPPATGTFRDGDPQGGALRDVPPSGPLRDPHPQATGTFRDAGLRASGGAVSGPLYGEGTAYGEGPSYNDGPSGRGFGTGQSSGPVYGAQPAGPVYNATRAPDPGATRGPDDLFAAQAYQPEERAGRRKLPLPGEAPPEKSGGGRRTAIILGVLAALVIGAGTAGAATFLGGDDPEPTKSQPAVAQPGGQASTPGGGTSAPAAGGAAGQEVTMTATGDIVMGMAPGGLPPNNGKGFFDPVKEFLTADFQMGNLEQVLTEDTGVGKCSAESAGKTCFAFRTPPGYVSNLKDAGFHMMTMANNHAYDFGEVGYKNSQKALDGAGIKYTGWPGMISVGEAKGVKIAVVGFASYKWSNLCSDLGAAETIIKEAATKADLVVVQVHQGAEGSDKTHTKPGTEFFLGENRCDTIAFAHKVIDAGADLVVGHGPHVMRAMEFYKGRLIAYSLGNFAGYKALSYNGTVGIGGVLKVTMTGDGTFKSGSLTATYMVAPGLPKPDPKKQAIPFVSNLTKQDFPSTGAKIAADGTITQPSG
ncbi:CapA family protein [Dactylosporangium sp. NPDC006015]|uniref:CapA family protein n=1 Tax=Dactylosporangium sp. NPDC006015 TaxID=3154576 RepID=UPI0033ABFAF6